MAQTRIINGITVVLPDGDLFETAIRCISVIDAVTRRVADEEDPSLGSGQQTQEAAA